MEDAAWIIRTHGSRSSSQDSEVFGGTNTVTVMATQMPEEVFLTWMIPNQTTYLQDNKNAETSAAAAATTTTTTTTAAAALKKKAVLPRYTIVLNEFMENVHQELQPEIVLALYKHLNVDKRKQRRLFGMQKSIMDQDNKTHEAAQRKRQQRRQQRLQLKQNSQQWNRHTHSSLKDQPASDDDDGGGGGGGGGGGPKKTQDAFVPRVGNLPPSKHRPKIKKEDILHHTSANLTQGDKMKQVKLLKTKKLNERLNNEKKAWKEKQKQKQQQNYVKVPRAATVAKPKRGGPRPKVNE
jgi:hypothetical protein